MRQHPAGLLWGLSRAGLVSVLLVGRLASAQISTFDLSGTVRDEQGGILPGATVTMRNEATGLVRSIITDEHGRYYFANLPPQGSWELTATLAGFAAYRQTGLAFYANTKPVLNLVLRLGKIEETVVVAREAPLIDTGQATLGLSIEKRQIQELPLNGRDYLDLAVLGSGVSEVTGPGSTVLGSKSQSISGAYARYTQYQLDGFANTRDQHGVQKTDIALDAISEFRVLTNQFSAEYGETIGGIVSVITKSGTNTIQGTAYLFARPGAWDARDRLTGRKAPFNRQDLGGTVGGPFAKDRTHYFVSVEYRNEDSQAIVTAPIGGGQFQGTFPVGANRTRALLRVDHQFNAANLLAAKVVVGDETIRDGVGGLNIAENLRTNINDDVTVHGTYTRLFSHRTLNEFRLGYATEDYSSKANPPRFTPTGVALIYPGQGNLGATNLLQTAPDSTVELADVLTLHRTNHTLKVGGNAWRATPGGALHTFLNGAYQFAPGAPYPYDPAEPRTHPILYTQGFFGSGDPELRLIEWHTAVFIQDDWKLAGRLTLNLGLRYQRESSVPDKDNLAPRVGFSWDLHGDARTVLRGGAGVFHSAVFSAIDAFEGFLNPNGFRTVTFAPGDPLFPQFPNTLPGPNLPPGVRPPPGNFYFEASKYAPGKRRSPESRNFTIGIERQFGADTAVAVDLSHNRGVKLVVPTDLNAPAFFNYATGARRSATAADLSRPFGVPGRPIRPGEIGFIPQGYPLSGYRDLYLLEGDGRSEYTALRLQITRRYADRFSLQGHYTWSRSRNNGDDFRPGNSLPLNPNDRQAEWGRSFTDIPHSFALTGVWTLPREIQFSGIVRARSGAPVDPRVGQDLNGDRNTRERPFANGQILQRNSFRGPGFFSADLGVSKRVRVGRVAFEGRFEVFNLTNRLNPDTVDNTYGPDATRPLPTFLKVTAAGPPRQFQLAARVTF